MNRREFLLLTAGLAGGCTSVNESAGPAKPKGPSHIVDAGPVGAYEHDGVYSTFMHSGFFVVRSGGSLTAISSYCTHRACALETEADRTFYCPCHGSTFDPKGKVTEGPAVKDLPILATVTSGAGHLMVSVPAMS